LRHGVAAAALLPAIFVQVPSGLAASGSLLAGLSTADQITNTTTYANGTAKISGNLTSTVSIHDGLGHSFLKVHVHATGQKLYLTLPMAVCSSASDCFPLSSDISAYSPICLPSVFNVLDYLEDMNLAFHECLLTSPSFFRYLWHQETSTR